MDNGLILECYKKSIELLENNSTEFGILASSKQPKAIERNYLSIFARDSAICSLGMIASKDKKLIKTVKSSILNLGKYQAYNGQIPNRVKPEIDNADFWKLGSIDATLWWLIAVNFYDKNALDRVKLEKQLKVKIQKAIFWLQCQEHVMDKLIMQNEASDWADEMPRSGKVLYSNALWYKVKMMYGIINKEETKLNFNNLFSPYSNKKKVPICQELTVEAIRKEKKDGDYLLSFVNYMFWGKDIDVYGNSLAVIFDLVDNKSSKKYLDYILKKDRIKELPVPVLFNPIKKGSREWRKYMEKYDSQSNPHQYHNGGIWPYASCFLVIALMKAGKKKEALMEFEKIAQANKINDWGFYEWFNSKTGKYGGMRGQSWNAGVFIFVYHYLKGEIDF